MGGCLNHVPPPGPMTVMTGTTGSTTAATTDTRGIGEMIVATMTEEIGEMTGDVFTLAGVGNHHLHHLLNNSIYIYIQCGAPKLT